MQIKGLVTYESWDLEKPAIPLRSCLYHLEPIGIGTPYVESLTSYIARLAETHCVSTGLLIMSKIAPLVKEGYVWNGKDRDLDKIYRSSDSFTRALNGIGSMATTCVQAIETLTRRDRLHLLTLLNFAEVLPRKDLLRPFKAWCPICYQEWHLTGKVVYEPLIWAFTLISICPNHHQPLLDHCPQCHQKIPFLAWNSRSGYCSKCRGWLGISQQVENPDDSVLSQKELEWQLWVIENMQILLKENPNLSCSFPRENIKKSIYSSIEKVSEGETKAFASLLDKDRHLIRDWCTGRSIPLLNTILLICQILKISIIDFLNGNLNDDKLITEKNQDKEHKKYKITPI